MKKTIFSIIAALGFVTDGFLNFEYICDYTDGSPKFYGFPFVQETDKTWPYSMSGEIYLLGFIGNVLFWTVLIIGIISLLNSIKKKLLKKVIYIFGWLIFAWSSLMIFMNFTLVDWKIKLTHNNFKMNYYQSDIDCKHRFILRIN